MTDQNTTSNRRTFLKSAGTVSSIGLLSSIAGCTGGGGDGNGSESKTLEFNSPAGEGSIQGLIPTWLSEYVAEQDTGLEIETYHGGELGGHSESVDNLTTGALDMYIGGYGTLSGHYERAQAFTAPFLYEDPNHAVEMLDREENDGVDEVLTELQEQANVRAMGPAIQGVRRLTTSNTRVTEPADLNDLTIRAPGIPIYVHTVEAMGATTTQIDQPEIPTALATGTADGQENPYNIIYGDGIYEHQSYVIETNHMITPMPMLINADVYDNLSDEHQEALDQAVSDTVDHAVSWLDDETQNIKETLREEGLEIVEQGELNRSEWEEPVKQRIREEFDQEFIDTIERINPDY